MKKTDFINPEYYKNRELSWLSFNERVLSEAKDKELVPLFERLKFLSITASNLDEFFMIRVASLKDQIHAGYDRLDIAGMTSQEQIEAISQKAHEFIKEQYITYRGIKAEAEKAGLCVVEDRSTLTAREKKFLNDYFNNYIYPVLTPLAVDSSRPFPLVRNNTLNIGALISEKHENGEKLEFATVQVPSVLPRFIKLPQTSRRGTRVIFLEDVIIEYISQLFQHYDVECAYPYRIIRNMDISIDEDDAEDLLKEIEKQIKKRKWGEVIRLEVRKDVDKRLLKVLKKEFDVDDQEIYKIDGPLDLTFLNKVYDLEGFEKYKNLPHKPARVKEFAGKGSMFDVIRDEDVLVHHPYQSFGPVVKFVQEAAKDPNVLAIKQTLYRVSGDSPIIAALTKAAENNKQVTVLVELKARFDEENNIVWAKKLEQAGCNVIYGLKGLKTHCKITLVVRNEKNKINRYVHLGTGNYNDSTAKQYTDFGLFTCDPKIGEDATAVFNMISGYSEPEKWNKLILAPFWLKDRFLSMIKREERNAAAGKKGHIIAKMNSLCDRDIIEALYRASAAGVKIELIVRGICCLRVGVPGVSETISVRSIVGNYLEHSRIFYFYNNGNEEVYLGSADWMPRNLIRRLEVVFPVESEELKKKVINVLKVELLDNVKAHVLQPDGTYLKEKARHGKAVNSQLVFREEADKKNKKKVEALEHRFVPEEKA